MTTGADPSERVVLDGLITLCAETYGRESDEYRLLLRYWNRILREKRTADYFPSLRSQVVDEIDWLRSILGNGVVRSDVDQTGYRARMIAVIGENIDHIIGANGHLSSLHTGNVNDLMDGHGL